MHLLLEQLLPLLTEPDFDEIFNRLTDGESNNARFLLKMELKRKATPCVRSLDMRGKGYAAESYVYAGIQHYLGSDDLEIFQTQLKCYRNLYTIGVYEAVVEAHKRHLKLLESQMEDPSHDPLKFEVDGVQFASYYQRREERMHYSSAVILQRQGEAPVQARTTDISPSGLRIGLTHPIPFEMGETCQVLFSGLQKEFPSTIINQSIPYQIIGEDVRDNRFWLKLIRQDPSPELALYFSNFIEQNKMRYRVSVDYLLSSIEVKGYEQYYLPRMTGLPLFFDQSTTPQLRYALKSENNQSVLEYWRDEHNHDKLTGLFTPERMRRLLAQPGTHKQCWIYCFTHTVRSHIYFFSATQDELEEQGLRELFFTVGAKRSSWRQFKLDLEPIDLSSHDRTSLINLDNLPPTHITSVENQLKELGYVGQLTAIDDELQRKDCQEKSLDEYQANDLRLFAHNSDTAEFNIELLYYAQLRRELRYLHKTAIAVKAKNAQAVIGWTRDLSTMGLQIELQQTLVCQAGDVIHITLPKLQPLTKDMKLSDLPYRIVKINATGTVLNLMIEGTPNTHVGRQFFQLLIDSNQDKLQATRELKRTNGLARALRNLFTHHLFNTPLFLSKGKPNRLGILGCIDKPRPLQRLLAESRVNKPYNLLPLFHDEMLKRLILTPMRELQREDTPLQFELYIHRKHDRIGNLCYDTRLESDFFSLDDKRKFVLQALKQGAFTSVRLYLSRAGRPDMDYIASELDYVAKYAIHKAKHLEESLWSVIGLCDLQDTTATTLYRLAIKM